MKEIKLNIEWRTNEYYEMNVVTLLLTDDKIETIQKSQQFLKENRDVDSIRVRVDQNCLTSDTDYKLGYGFVMVGSGDALHFIGTDHHDSQYQVETESFELELENFSMSEIEDYVDEWGQTNDEICSELGYDEDDEGSDEMLIGDGYFWLERYQKWFPKCSSLYSEREEKISEYIRTIYC
jgi:hypothetical protein